MSDAITPRNQPPFGTTLRGLAVAQLAGALITAEDVDDAIDALRIILDEQEMEYLFRMMERCPIHGCDRAICDDDDNPDCREERKY
jgi:hypothetical protein